MQNLTYYISLCHGYVSHCVNLDLNEKFHNSYLSLLHRYTYIHDLT